MPNWCNNNISISHPDRRQMVRLARAVRAGRFLNHVIPVPKELTETMAGSYGDDEKQKALEAQEKSNLEKYGAKNWYDFCVNEWGTKWDVDPYERSDVRVDKDNTIYFGFDSAWSPPVGVYEKLVEQGYTVLAQYYEPGMGYVGEWDNGCDDCYDYSGYNSKTVRDLIGEELDELYGISESMAEYEAEEMDEVQTWYEDGVEKKGLTPHEN